MMKHHTPADRTHALVSLLWSIILKIEELEKEEQDAKTQHDVSEYSIFDVLSVEKTALENVLKNERS